MRLIPLGDQAVFAYLADETSASRFAGAVRRAGLAGVVDVVQAYASVAVFYDLDRTTFAVLASLLQGLAADGPAPELERVRRHRIPCCYERQLDLAGVADHTGLSLEQVIRAHLEMEYTVYAIGFCPGFPYLGYLPQILSGVPRLPAPRLRVDEGSVGLTGRQTGIYTAARPGGWNIIGRTPLKLVDVADQYFPLRTGDRVQFERIDEATFQRLQGQRL